MKTVLKRDLKKLSRGRLLAAPSFFTVIDSYPIELLFPIHQGRSLRQVGKKRLDKGR